jgi:hypothetical protein
MSARSVQPGIISADPLTKPALVAWIQPGLWKFTLRLHRGSILPYVIRAQGHCSILAGPIVRNFSDHHQLTVNHEDIYIIWNSGSASNEWN